MQQINSSFDVFEILRSDFNPAAEGIWILALDCQLRVLSKHMLFRGTVNHCMIHPRDIFRWVILHNASSFILAHNHPSQEALPSEQDLIITRKILKICKLIEIPMEDHVVFTADGYFSMADHGIFKSGARKMTY